MPLKQFETVQHRVENVIQEAQNSHTPGNSPVTSQPLPGLNLTPRHQADVRDAMHVPCPAIPWRHRLHSSCGGSLPGSTSRRRAVIDFGAT